MSCNFSQMKRHGMFVVKFASASFPICHLPAAVSPYSGGTCAPLRTTHRRASRKSVVALSRPLPGGDFVGLSPLVLHIGSGAAILLLPGWLRICTSWP